MSMVTVPYKCPKCGSTLIQHLPSHHHLFVDRCKCKACKYENTERKFRVTE